MRLLQKCCCGRKKIAFTLAEVLITLSILGVVAAISIPSIIQNYQKQATVSRLKIAYSILDNLTQLSFIENGYPPIGSISNEIFDKYFRPYLNISKDCGVRFNSRYEKEKGCLKNDSLWGLNGTNYTTGSHGYSYYYSVVLRNGITLGVWNRPTSLPDFPVKFIVDIDGPNRGDSKFGQDIFVFTYMTNNLGGASSCYNGLYLGNIIPKRVANCKMTKELANDAYHSFDCVEGGDGTTCAWLIVNDGWKISSDYPWGYAHKK